LDTTRHRAANHHTGGFAGTKSVFLYVFGRRDGFKSGLLYYGIGKLYSSELGQAGFLAPTGEKTVFFKAALPDHKHQHAEICPAYGGDLRTFQLY
jgi:hypothetical protein